MIICESKIWGLVLAPFFICSSILAEDSTKTSRVINERNEFIVTSCIKFNISPQILSSIIYVERQLNYNWRDEVFDLILAKTGHNSSIGFCQVKLKTAYWIEVQLNDSSSLYFPGNAYANILLVSQSPDELIAKLKNDSLNIIFAAAYMKIILSRWKKAGHAIDKSPDIIGTLYSAGLFYPDGSERIPRTNPRANKFGIKVKEALQRFHEY
jgi:hypothetical protein